MAIARAAIDAREWQAARNALGGVLRANPTERVCLLMAEIETGEHGDQARARAWLTRALVAPRDPVWTADGQVFEHWAPLSPVTGKLDAFQWRVVEERRPVRLAFDIDGAGEGEATPGEVADVERAEPVRAGPAAPIVPMLVSIAPPPGVEAKPAVAEPVRSSEARLPLPADGGAPAKGARPMARAPDDPGPDVNDDDGDLPLFYPGRPA
jgi:HemY protein